MSASTATSEIWTGKARSYDRARPTPPTPKDQHLNRMRESGHFRFLREALLHHVEPGDAARHLMPLRSNAFSGKLPFTDEEMGLDRLRAAALRSIGTAPVPWHVSCRVRIGVK